MSSIARTLTALFLPLLFSCTAPDEKKDIVYDNRFGADTSMDVYLPDDDAVRRPGVLFIHGGSWRGGSKDHFKDAGRRLARSGYVVASANYRLLPDGVFPRNAHDCICALAFFRGHADEYGLDPDRIVVMGYSAGAHLASLVGVSSDHPEMTPDCDAAGGRPVPRPKGVIAAAGSQDFRLMWEDINDKSFVEEIMGGSPREIPHAYELASPRWYVQPGIPPYLLITDAFDHGFAAEMWKDVRNAGSDARLLKIAGGLHILQQHADPGIYEAGMSTETPEAWIAIDDFLARSVGRGRP